MTGSAKQSRTARAVFPWSWIASSRSLSSGAHSRDPVAPRNDDKIRSTSTYPVELFRPDRRILQVVIVVGLAQHPVRRSLRHELRDEGQRLRMVQGHGDGGHRLLEGFVEHLGARNLRGHGVELVARQRERIDLAVLQLVED